MSMPASIRGQTYWHNRGNGPKAKPRVRVRYDRVLADRPLLKVFLEADPDRWGLDVIQAPRGTNFPMRAREWQILLTWLDGAEN